MSAVGLGSTSDARVLVLGDVGTLIGTMWRVRAVADSLTRAGRGLTRVQADVAWRGEAADAFRARLGEQPQRWRVAGESFGDVASALDAHASALQSGQSLAQSAIGLWEQATTLSAADAGAAQACRQRAHQVLSDAREGVRRSGERAAAAVAAARDRAPKGPGFWARAAHVVGATADGLTTAGADAVNGVASLGNAALHHPEDLAMLWAGVALMDISAGGEAFGLALDATGVGTAAGVPLNAASAMGLVAGAGMSTAAAGDLTYHAMSDDRVSPVQGAPRSSGSGSRGTKTDRLREHLTDRDLQAARRELNGDVVARKPDGTPWNHVQEVREAQTGLAHRIEQLKRQLGDTRTAAADRPALEAELSEASRLLDLSERFVPRH